MRFVCFLTLLTLMLSSLVPAFAQAGRAKTGITDKKKPDTTDLKLDTTDLGTKPAKAPIGSGAEMTDTATVIPDTTEPTINPGTGTTLDPASGTVIPGTGTVNPSTGTITTGSGITPGTGTITPGTETTPGTVSPNTGTSQPTGTTPPGTAAPGKGTATNPASGTTGTQGTSAPVPK